MTNTPHRITRRALLRARRRRPRGGRARRVRHPAAARRPPRRRPRSRPAPPTRSAWTPRSRWRCGSSTAVSATPTPRTSTSRCSRRSIRTRRSSTTPPRRSPRSCSRGSPAATRRTSSTTPAPTPWTWARWPRTASSQDLTPLLDAPSWDDPAVKVRDTLDPAVVEFGTYDGKFSVLGYVNYIHGIWYSQKALPGQRLDGAEDLGRVPQAVRDDQEVGQDGAVHLRRQAPAISLRAAAHHGREDRRQRGPGQHRQPRGRRLVQPSR